MVAVWALLWLRPAHLLCSCGALASHCSDFSWCGAQALEHSLNSCGAQASLLCSMWDLPKQGLNPCRLHWQADSLPLIHQGNPHSYIFFYLKQLCSVKVWQSWVGGRCTGICFYCSFFVCWIISFTRALIGEIHLKPPLRACSSCCFTACFVRALIIHLGSHTWKGDFCGAWFCFLALRGSSN